MRQIAWSDRRKIRKHPGFMGRMDVQGPLPGLCAAVTDAHIFLLRPVHQADQ